MEGARFGDRPLAAPSRLRVLSAARLELAALAFATVGALATVIIALMVVRTGYANVPFWDQWGYVQDGALWSHPLKHHNEHQILAARVFYTVDAWLGGRQLFNIASTLVIQLGSAAGLTLLARAAGAVGRRTPLAFLLALCFTFSASQYENFIWGFQVQFALVYAALVAGAAFSVLYDRTERPQWLVLALASGLVSACSMANGLLAAPLLCVLLFMLGRRRAALAMLGVAAVGVALYMVGPFTPVPSGAPMDLGQRIAKGIPFGLAYLGAPFAWILQDWMPRALSGPDPDVWPVAQIDGVLVAVVLLLGLVAAVRGPRAGRAGRLGLGAVILFGLLSAMAATYGRTPFGPQGALAVRYGTCVMTVVAASLLSIWTALAERRPAGRAAPALIAAAAALLMVYGFASREALRPATNLRLAREGAMLALVAGAPDTSLLQMVTYAPQSAIADAQDLRRHRRSVFAEPWAQAMGQPLSVAAPKGVGGTCEGIVNASAAGEDALHGMVWAPPAQRPTRALLLTDAEGKVVGVGRVRAQLKDVMDGGLRHKHQPVDWLGVVGPDGQGRALTAYLLVDGGRRACRIGAVAASAPLAAIVTEPTARTPLELVSTEQSGVFTPSGANPEPGPAPAGARFYGSWAGADANTGRLVLRYRLPQGAAAVVTPVVAGPATDGQSLVFRLAPSGKVIGMADLSNATRWSWRRLALPPEAAGQTLEVEAQDRGAGWGQWVAVGQTYAEGASN
jgi:hypothetical protein